VIRALAGWCLLLPLVGCNKELYPIRPDAAVPLEDNDTRRSLVGRWSVEFTVDSLMQRPDRWVLPGDTEASAAGTLELRDTLATVRHPTRGLRAYLDVDFTSILHRQVSCYEPGPMVIQVERKDSDVAMWFTPGAADCGFGARGRFFGDSLIGAWSETSFSGPIVEGQFRMVRLKGSQ
jgi:hypothetical protein